MHRVVTSEKELQVLRALCGEAASREQRLELLESLAGHIFLDPENRVVFESVRFLVIRGGGDDAARLAVHLNNRGFPDIDLEKYFPAESADTSGLAYRLEENK